jgi:hypothetical protein
MDTSEIQVDPAVVERLRAQTEYPERWDQTQQRTIAGLVMGTTTFRSRRPPDAAQSTPRF